MSQKTMSSESELEAKLRAVDLGTTLKTNGQRNIEKATKKIFAEAERADKRADKRAAAMDKATTAAGDEAMAAGDDPNFVDLGGDADGAAGGAAATTLAADGVTEVAKTDEDVAKEALTDETAADIAEYKHNLKSKGVTDEDINNAIATYNDVDDDGVEDDEADLDNQNALDDDDDDAADEDDDDDDAADDEEESEEIAAKSAPKRAISKKTPRNSATPAKTTPTMTTTAAEPSSKKAKKATGNKRVVILSDPEEIARENAKALSADGTMDANAADEFMMAEIARKEPMTNEEAEVEVEAAPAKKKRRRAATSQPAAAASNGHAVDPIANGSASTATIAAGDTTARIRTSNGAEEEPRAALKRKQKAYYEENLTVPPEAELRGYLKVVAADYLRNQPSDRENKSSIFAMLNSVSLTDGQFDKQQPLLDTTAEALRNDVAYIEALISVMLGFVRDADAEAFNLIAYSLLGGVKKVTIVQAKANEQEKLNENSDEHVVCAIIGRPVLMRDTRLLQCTGSVGSGDTLRKVQRELRVYRSLAQLVAGIHTLEHFTSVVSEAVAPRLNGKLMKQSVKERPPLAVATKLIVEEPVADSAFNVTKRAFKAALDGVRNSIGKFDEARKAADKLKAQIEIEAVKKAASSASHLDADADEDSVELDDVIEDVDDDDDADDDDENVEDIDDDGEDEE